MADRPIQSYHQSIEVQVNVTEDGAVTGVDVDALDLQAFDGDTLDDWRGDHLPSAVEGVLNRVAEAASARVYTERASIVHVRGPNDPIAAPYEARYLTTFTFPGGKFATREQVSGLLQLMLYDVGGMGGNFQVLTEGDPNRVKSEWTVLFLRDSEQDYHRSYEPEHGHDGSDAAGIRQLLGELEDAGLRDRFTITERRVYRDSQEV